jgi:signal transduction histidine kinase
MLKNKKLIITLFLIVQIIIIQIFKHFPEFIEQFYSNGIYIFISKLTRYIFGWIPFSVGDIFYTLAGILIIRWLIVNRKRIFKDTINWLLDIGATLSIAYFAFHIFWAFNYYRQPLYKSLNIEAEYSTGQLVDFTKRLIEKSNVIHNELAINDSTKVEMPFSKSEVFDKVKNGYKVLAKTYPHLNYNPKSIKKSLYSTPLTYMGFSGYLNPFTNEAQVDGLIPTYKFPTTSCHEIAHQLGYAAENEANFIGCLAAIYNDDMYFKYSGYTFGLRYCLVEIYKRDEDLYYEILATVNKGILKNYEEVKNFWRSYENPLEPVFEKTFDSFLKANNQSAGMKSYSYVVALLVNYYNDKPL